MKSTFFKAFAVLSLSGLLAGSFSAVHAANATSLVQETTVVNGHVSLDVFFDIDQTSYVQNWLVGLQEESGLKQNAASSVRELQKNKLYKQFHSKGDKGHFTTNLVNAEVKIGDQVVQTDLEGNFTVTGLSEGEHPVTVSQFGKVVHETTIKVTKGNNKAELVVSNQLGTLFEAMDGSKGNKKHDSDVAVGNLEGGVINEIDPGDTGGATSYHGKVVGEFFGSGPRGYMELLTYDGHVSCNKSDGDNGANFPTNSSDCANAIGGGLIYNSSPMYNYNYYQGTMCVTEGMATVFYPKETNVYCDTHVNTGSNKPTSTYYRGYLNLGYNCSSFTFLNGDERLNNYNF